MTRLLGLPLEDALAFLRARGIEPEIVTTRSLRASPEGRERVIRISEDGRRVTVARFPDEVKTEDS